MFSVYFFVYECVLWSLMRFCILEYSYRSSFTYPPSLFHSSFLSPPPQRCMDIVGDVLTDAGVAATEVDEVIPVGEATRMPLLRTTLLEMFVVSKLCTSMNPDEVVAEQG